MKKALLMLSAVSVLLTISCSKSIDIPEDEKTEESCKIETLNQSKDDGSTENQTPIFDSMGRLSQWTVKGSGYESVENFQYESGKITVTGVEKTNNDSYNFSTVYNLDNEGRISNVIESYYNMPLNIEYNTDGYLSEIKYAHSGINPFSSNVVYTYKDGNLIKILTTSNQLAGVHQRILEITYNNDEITDPVIYDFLFSRVNRVYDEYFTNVSHLLGKRSKNAIKIITETDGLYTANETFTYERDSKGNITKVTETSSNGINVLNVSYKCD